MWILYRDNKNPTKLGTNGPKNHGYLGSGYLGSYFLGGGGGWFCSPPETRRVTCPPTTLENSQQPGFQEAYSCAQQQQGGNQNRLRTSSNSQVTVIISILLGFQILTDNYQYLWFFCLLIATQLSQIFIYLFIYLIWGGESKWFLGFLYSHIFFQKNQNNCQIFLSGSKVCSPKNRRMLTQIYFFTLMVHLQPNLSRPFHG